MNEKQELAAGIRERKAAALAVMEPQWKQCKRTKPRGHLYDGLTLRDFGGRKFNQCCIYCGAPKLYNEGVDVYEDAAAIAGRFPIALAGSSKAALA